MGGGTIKTATAVSANSVRFDFPYQGEQRARLTLREHPRRGKDVMLSIERGQFLAGILGSDVLVRFDDGRPQTFRARGAADHSTTTIFISGYPKFVENLKRSKRVMIEAPIYREGNR